VQRLIFTFAIKICRVVRDAIVTELELHNELLGRMKSSRENEKCKRVFTWKVL